MAQDHEGVETEGHDDIGTTEIGTEGEVETGSLTDELDGEDAGEGDAESDEPEDDELPETSDFAVNDPTMLLGEMRDTVLDGIKGPVGWSKLKEVQQTFIANAVEQACRRGIRGAVQIAAAMEFDTIEVTIKDPGLKSEKEQIEAKIIMHDDADAWMRLREHGKRLLVFADHEQFMGARAVEVMKDQPGLFPDGTETPAEKAKREAIEAEHREHEESVARAGQFIELKEPETAKLVGEMLPPAIKDAVDRGIAHRQAGGGRKFPVDLEGKPNEVQAWLKGYDTAAASSEGHAVDGATGEVTPEPAKPPRGHRGKRTTVEERIAKRVAETAGA